MAIEKQVGRSLKRKEDVGLLTGHDPYVADVRLTNALHCTLVRSTQAHAQVHRIWIGDAQTAKGVVAVLTATDFTLELGEIPMAIGKEAFDHVNLRARRVLCEGKTRYVGEPLAIIVADSPYAAQDAADLVQIEYDVMDAVTDAEASLQGGAPRIHERFKTNVGVRWERSHGDLEAAFVDAPVRVEATLRNQRLMAAAMEPRAVAASYDKKSGELTVWGSTQIPHGLRDAIAQYLKMEPAKVRLIAPRVGGGFGAKIALYSEDLLVPWIARKLERPVRWTASRREDLMSTSHGRDVTATLRLVADRDGRIRGLKARIVGNLGFTLFSDGPLLPVLCGQMITGCYDIPAVRTKVVGVYTNTMGTAAYRGAGRPEAAYFIERMVDLLAHELQMDPAEVRRKNFIPPSAFPYQAPMGPSYDSGNYAGALDALLERAGYAALRAEQAQARAAGRLVGIGLASYVEMCGFVDEETSDVVVGPDGTVTVLTGCSSHGQGHETSFAQVVADELQVPVESVTVVHGDTRKVRKGTGTFGSRSMARGGMAALDNAREVAGKARRIAAHLLEARADDVTVADGAFQVRGVPDRRVTWADVARAAHQGPRPADMEAGLEGRRDYVGQGLLYPFGAHLAMLEVDADTGSVRILRYVTVDDSGTIVNPLLAAGQVHGGLAQGIGQALWESTRYDKAGQLLTGTLMDYSLAKAADLPAFETGHTATPSPRTALGVKGIGESATIGSTPAIANAVMDALAPLGVRHLDIPLTPDRVWQAIHAARGGPTR